MNEFRLRNAPRATSVDGVWVRDVPLEARRRIADLATQLSESDEQSSSFEHFATLMVELFKEVIVDEEGEVFTNIKSIADVNRMGMDRLLEVQSAVMEVLDPGKPLKRTGRSRSKSTSSSKGTRRNP